MKKSTFGKMPDGTPVRQFTLANSNGLVCKVINYGVTITSLQVPDARGRLADVILGFDDLDGHIQCPYFGPVVGRVANRIGGAKFTLDGKTFVLTANEGKNQLHGGKKGFDKIVWTAKPAGGTPTLPESVEFSHTSRDGDEGYPGNLQAKVRVTLTDENELRLDYEAKTDRPTPVNFTSHGYFNLADGGDVLGHELMLAADFYTPTDAQLIPTGEIKPVKGTPLDFTKPAAISSQMKKFGGPPPGYDCNFVINHGGKKLTLAARVREPKSGRVLEAWTTQPGVQFYTANHFNGIPGRNGTRYEKFGAFCLETQHFPDSVNQPQFPSIILRPGGIYRQSCVYKFPAE
jgi:aldose 1-epimerase